MRAWAAIVSVLALLATPALAAPPTTVFLEELTWPELRGLIASGTTTIILPIGGTEQNGPHMVLGKHNVRVRALSERIARVLANAVVGPVIAYVPEGGVKSVFPGEREVALVTVGNPSQVLIVTGHDGPFHDWRAIPIGSPLSP